jgi:hypothetical protein
MVEINLNVVKGMVSIIDVCSKRGAFEGNELATVGQIRSEILAAAKDELEAEAAAAAEEKSE